MFCTVLPISWADIARIIYFESPSCFLLLVECVVELMNTRSDWSVKIGLLLVCLSWFSFTFYEFVAGVVHRGITWPVIFTDLPGTLGLGFRTGASFIAVVTVLFYVCKRDLSKPEALMSLRWVLVFEAANFVSLLPSGLWSFVTPYAQTLLIIVESTLPCLVESILIPVVLTKLFFELNPNKPAKGAIKWGLIAGAVYLFVFWLNYTCNWLGTIITKGVEYVSLYPVNLFSFILTSVGLLLIALTAAFFAKKSIGKEDLATFDFRRLVIF